ncbi:Right handed beta helix region [uncultured Caudovirales phage]|uniref:Right handed beta helix region n=1 Tax=uncultured Caudovirales phage TaxID=2100421 RepID=A0A6J5KK24_9CAUD|nr:Right handed beta helix region [uncultured Caudovirales phage]
MTVNISSYAGAGWQLFDNNGVPLSGGFIYSYAAGTTTPVTTYTSASGLIANTNPIVLDASGRIPFEIWLTAGANYKFVLKDSTGVQIGSYDDIPLVGDYTAVSAQIAALTATLASPTGSLYVGYQAPYTGSVATTVFGKLAYYISVKDFGAKGDGTTDDTAAIQAAVNACNGKQLYFPFGTYLVSSIIDLVSDLSIVGDIKQSVLKIKTGTYTSANASIFRCNAIHNVYVYGIDFNGNKGNIGTARNPINTVYNSQNVIFDTCRWITCEGICLNVSTDPNGLRVLNCTFSQCGGATDNSDGYRNQAIAFSGSSTTFAVGIYIIGNYFYAQGLDCISLANCNDVIISNNIAEDSYSFLYNNPSPYRTVNLTVTGNAIRNTNQGSLVNTVNPVAIDLPFVSNATITGNAIFKCAQSGIGIFEGSSNVVIDGNTLVDCGISPVSWSGGISVGGGLGTASGISEVVITDNSILSTGNYPRMPFGILIGNDIEALTISENNIVNPLFSKFGYYLYTTVPVIANSYALTTNANTSATTLINDFDAYTQTITNWRKANTLTGFYFNGTKVVGIQQAAIPNGADATVNAILAALRTHGLIAT